ncbi:hypothetical protein KDX38_27905 [Pseudomonas sp. CDFA 602]|uniref:hypothetical protein n=1 Tax=Pseudomonas californiensis TaxID=2829823 RepID=UPI001E54E9EA|nr:hypothetical protein [Pseudomonas californiensis]MCD5996797.1 hypothetical protein [Pseudomonas californiensis]MCD6002985.1 hypothetical protein [Pseudomonas californiensis]
MQSGANAEEACNPPGTAYFKRLGHLGQLHCVINTKDFSGTLVFENHPFHLFSNFSPKRAGPVARSIAQGSLQRVVQARDISLQNFARSAMAAALCEPTDGVPWSIGCTTPGVCTFWGRKARRREGDKCFFIRFFILVVIFENICYQLKREFECCLLAE